MIKPSWVSNAEKRYGSSYVGLYDLPDREGPFYIFYQPNPKTELGHSHYFGLFWQPKMADDNNIFNSMYITNTKTILKAKFPAIWIPESEVEPGYFLVSRYRHDYVTASNGAMLDGGLGAGGYTRLNPKYPVTHYMTIVKDKEVFTLIGEENEH